MHRSIFTLLTAILLLFSTILNADSINHSSADLHSAQKDSGYSEATTRVELRKQNVTTEKRKQITNEALIAINETYNALTALDKGKNSEALASLERATGKLELILVREPNLALAPMNLRAITIDVNSDPDKIMTLRKEAQSLLESGQVQAARHLLNGLASETVISVTNIPLGTYPTSIKNAVKLVDDGKIIEAKKVLQRALNTLVITNTVIPLPIVQAQELLRNAEILSEKPNRNTDENKRLSTLLTDAHKELELAQALGYGSQQDFKNMYNQLGEIESKTTGGKFGKGFFKTIKEYLNNMLKSNQPGKSNNIFVV